MSRLLKAVESKEDVWDLLDHDVLLVFEGYDDDRFFYSVGVERPEFSGVFKFFITAEDAKGRYLGPFMPLQFLKGDVTVAIEEDRFEEILDPYGIPSA